MDNTQVAKDSDYPRGHQHKDMQVDEKLTTTKSYKYD